MKVLISLFAAIISVLLVIPPQLHKKHYKYNKIELTLLYPTFYKDGNNALHFGRSFSLPDDSEGTSSFVEPLRGSRLLCGMRACNDFTNQVRIEWLAIQRATALEKARLNEVEREIATQNSRRDALVASYRNENCANVEAGPAEPAFSCRERETWRPLGVCMVRTAGMKICDLGLGGAFTKVFPAFGAHFVAAQSCKAAMAGLMNEEYHIQDEIVSDGVGFFVMTGIRIAAGVAFGKLGMVGVDVADAAYDVIQCVPKMANRCENNYRSWLSDRERHFAVNKEQILSCQGTTANIHSIEQNIAILSDQRQLQEKKIQTLMADLSHLETKEVLADA